MNINIRLDRNFTVALNKATSSNPAELARLNGLSEEQLSYTDFIDNFCGRDVVADASIDGNANVKVKDMCTMLSEMNKPHLKLLTFNKIFYEMTKKWGLKTATDWLDGEYAGQFYLHDASTTSTFPYCFAYDLEQLAERGLFFIPEFNAQPPKHLETWTDFVGEFVSWTSNRTSGACGLPNFLVYSYYFWRKDVENGYYIKSPEYYRDQEFQRIIYKLNQPYLRVAQSAFTNFTIFDENYLVELFGGKQFPDGSYMVDSIQEIKEYQKRFMEVLADVRGRNAMTFPVMTFSLLFQNGRFVDEDFAKWCCRHNMKWGDSNFATFDDITSLSNCCVSGDQVIIVRDRETKQHNWMKLRKFVAMFHDGDGEFINDDGTQYETPSYDYEKGEWVWNPIDGVIRKLHKSHELLQIDASGRTADVTPDHRMEVINKITRLHETVPASMLVSRWREYMIMCEDMNRPMSITSVEKVPYEDDYVYCIDVRNMHNFCTTGMNIGNCRLVSDVKKLGYFNSIGGTSLSVGSVKVNTVNLARISYECGGSQDRYLKILRERVQLANRCLYTVRHIIRRNVEKGLLPNYTLGLIDMEHQYNTIGIIGIYETLEKFGLIRQDAMGYTYYTEEAIDFARRILSTIRETNDAFIEENQCGYNINIEQVPAERAASILMSKDRLFFPDEKYTLPLYANQWIPLGVKTSIKEKVRVSAILDRACSGGSIAHINIATPFKTFDAAWEALNFVARAGCNYFAFCYRISVCESNHSFFGETCPYCGKPKYTTVQRIVGFLVPEKNYSKERKAEYALRTFFDW